MSNVQCHRCGGWGHFAKDCATPQQHGGGRGGNQGRRPYAGRGGRGGAGQGGNANGGRSGGGSGRGSGGRGGGGSKSLQLASGVLGVGK